LKIIYITFIIVVFQQLSAEEIQITASVDRNPVGEQEQFVYQIEISGSSQNLPDIQYPDFSAFHVVGGPSTSSSVQIVNFKISATRTHTIVLLPRKKGTFQIGPARATYKGKEFASEAISITVTKSTTAQGQAPSGKQNKLEDVDLSQMVFLKVIPSQKTVYVNEEVTLNYKIYFRVNINNNEFSQLPSAVGCWVEEYPMPRRPSVKTETIQGVRFNVAEIKKAAVFPSKAGKITVTPLEMIVDVVVPRKKRRDSRSLFDDFFSDPFNQVVKKKISSGSLELNVLPLPKQGKPADFSGLVGKFQIQTSLDKNTVLTNEAVSYKIKVFGTGLLKYLNDLPLEFSPDFEVFDPKVAESVNKKGSRISSAKEYEYVLIPRVSGKQQLKAATIPYFDPWAKLYKNLKIPEFNIEVGKGKDLAASAGSGSVFSKEEIQLLGQDIRFIKENLSDLRPVGQKPYQNIWFYLSLLFPVILLGSAFLYRNHLEKMSTNIEYARSRKAQKMAQKRLSEAKNYLKQQQGAEFYAAVASGLVGYLADKSNRPAAGLVRGDIEALLDESSVNEDLVNKVLKCLDEADFRRFAPGSTTNTAMQDFYKHAEKLLIQLEKHF
jgi:hypothetical protein